MGTVWMSKGTMHWLLKLLCAKSSQEDSCRNWGFLGPRLKVLECCLCKWQTVGTCREGPGLLLLGGEVLCVFWVGGAVSIWMCYFLTFFFFLSCCVTPPPFSPYFGSLAPLTVYFSLKWASLYFHYKISTSLELKMEAVLRCTDPSPHSASPGFVFSPLSLTLSGRGSTMAY